MGAALSQPQADLANVLRYAKELIDINAKVLSDIDSLPFPRLYGYQLNGLEGISFPAPDQQGWGVLRRLREIPPPPPGPDMEGWVKQDRHPSPEKQPTLLEIRVVKMPTEEVDLLLESGALDKLDVLARPAEAESKPPEIEVIFHSAKKPELQQAWKAYLEGPWSTWAEAEKPRRRSIHIYNQFFEIQQRMVSMGADNPIELVCGIGMARWQHETGRINCPLVEQLMEIEPQDDGTLIIRPRQTDPKINLAAIHAAEVRGSQKLQVDTAETLNAIIKDPDVDFSPFDKRGYEKILAMCAAQISGEGIYLGGESDFDSGKPLPPADEKLKVYDSWVVYVRQRQENYRTEDIQRLIGKVESVADAESLPGAARKFVEAPSAQPVEPTDTVVDLADGILPSRSGGVGAGKDTRAPSGGKGAAAENTYFFPLPYNDDQMEIVQLLERHEGVLVQGPPGTGKTHTIANIICHYLAKGQRVLVTAQASEALTALQEKIPEAIRGLAISVINNDRDANAQLDRAVRLLSDEIKNYRIDDLDREIREKQGRLVSVIDEIGRIDRRLAAVADANHLEVVFQGRKMFPMDLAGIVFAAKGRHDWFADAVTLDPVHEAGVSEAEIAEVRTIRRQLSADLPFTLAQLPKPAEFPDLPDVMKAHAELARIGDIDRHTAGRGLPPMAAIPEARAMARELSDWLDGFVAFFDAARAESWPLHVFHRLMGVKPASDAVRSQLRELLGQWSELAGKAEDFMLKGIVLPIPAAEAEAFDRSISDLAVGKQPFGLFAFFKGGLKASLEAISIGGRKPDGPHDWAPIHAYREWQKAVMAFARRWNSIVPALDIGALPDDFEAARTELVRLREVIVGVVGFTDTAGRQRHLVKSLFPFGIDVDALIHHGDFSVIVDAVKLNVERADLASAHALRERLRDIAAEHPQPFFAVLREFAANLGNRDVGPGDMGEAWQKIVAEAQRLEELSSAISRLDAIVSKVSKSGAPQWADRLRWEAVDASTESALLPEDWHEAWEWRRAHSYVGTLIDRDAARKLNQSRAALEDDRRRIFLDVVRLRTFLGLKKRIVPSIESALAEFVTAVNRLGRGTGATAPRFRRLIREAAGRASIAVPCWIMPQWRVSEQLPAELGAFDLVIVDEASQSDITALPAILRAKKLLIVGDDKQVSPTPIGIETKKVTHLRMSYLQNMPFREHMDPATSLYELGSMIFPGKTVMLREHFRCVEPIIRFSSRFYPSPLVPLRIPKASERLEPPLVDIYVPHGRRDKRGKRNRHEAEVIVDEIVKLVRDPIFARRTIGVISLLGSEQAHLIYEMLLDEIGAEAMDRHHLMCGDSATFQGQERDIVFLSMVVSPDSAMSQTARLYEQRYNVAMSRARDRLYLVRSVSTSDLKQDDLKLKVIEHFRNPMGEANVVRPSNILEICDSGFERAVGKCLLDMGFRITPQYPISGYRIDFVIEGADDRRLAVELDGDRYHGPEQWQKDMARQRSLERLGWKFWRCWGSQWIADPDGCLDDLRDTLRAAGIEPLGATAVSGIYTQHIEIAAPDQGAGLVPTVAATVEPVQHDDAAAVGDLIVMSYIGQENRPLRYRLSQGDNDLTNGILSIREPLGAAVLGARADDEVAVLIGAEERRVVVLSVDKAQRVRANAA